MVAALGTGLRGLGEKNVTAPVWDYIGFRQQDEPANTEKALCTTCLKKVVVKDGIAK